MKRILVLLLISTFTICAWAVPRQRYEGEVINVLGRYEEKPETVRTTKPNEPIFEPGERRQDSAGTPLEGHHNRSFTNGDNYNGSWQNGLMHGHGTYSSHLGTKYVGFFINGQPDGKGTWYYQNGDIYEGSFHEGLIHGEGKYNFKNGDTYDGKFKDGRFEGPGTYKAKNFVLTGNFENGVPVSDLKIVTTESEGNEMTYQGEFKINSEGKIVFDGKGHWSSKTQELYHGDFKDGIPDGEGTSINLAQKLTYKGTWVNGRPHGTGVAVTTKAITMEGDFIQGKPHGDFNINDHRGLRGTLTYNNGQTDGQIHMETQGRRPKQRVVIDGKEYKLSSESMKSLQEFKEELKTANVLAQVLAISQFITVFSGTIDEHTIVQITNTEWEAFANAVKGLSPYLKNRLRTFCHFELMKHYKNPSEKSFWNRMAKRFW